MPERLVLRAEKEWPSAKLFCISSKNGSGLEAWMKEITERNDGGTHLTDVDYDIYAEGEAVLGWYNASFELKGHNMDGEYFLRSLMKILSERFTEDAAEIGHLKTFLSGKDEYLVANLTGIGKTITIHGSMGKYDEMRLTINARVQITPETLDTAVSEAVAQVCSKQINCITVAAKCLSPGRPAPTYRYDKVL